MPEFNQVILSGYVFDNPVEVFPDDNGQYEMAVNVDLTIEGFSPNQSPVLTVCFRGDVCHNAKALKISDYVILKGHIRTTNYERKVKSICPECKKISYTTVSSEKTEIIVDEKFTVIKRLHPYGLRGLNEISLMGNICSGGDDSTFYEDDRSGIVENTFKLAVDRHGESRKYQHADYPFVLTYGQMAQSVHNFSNIGDLVFVSGTVSQRMSSQRNELVRCPDCGTPYNKLTDSLPIIEVKARFVMPLNMCNLGANESMEKMYDGYLAKKVKERNAKQEITPVEFEEYSRESKKISQDAYFAKINQVEANAVSEVEETPTQKKPDDDFEFDFSGFFGSDDGGDQ